MKVSATIALLTGLCAYAAPLENETRAAAANLPHLDSTQSAHARAIIAQTKKENFGKYQNHACQAAITTGLTEASMLVYANSNVPASLKIPHDAVGSDHDSVGIFQQRVSIYKDIKADMDPAQSAHQFFTVMKGVSGWQTKDVAELCQAVERSAYPDAYRKYTADAVDICKSGGA